MQNTIKLEQPTTSSEESVRRYRRHSFSAHFNLPIYQGQLALPSTDEIIAGGGDLVTVTHALDCLLSPYAFAVAVRQGINLKRFSDDLGTGKINAGVFSGAILSGALNGADYERMAAFHGTRLNTTLRTLTEAANCVRSHCG